MTEPDKTEPRTDDALKKGVSADLVVVEKGGSAGLAVAKKKEPGELGSSALEAVTWPARRAGWAIERYVIWPLGDALRHLADVVTWPFERLAWAFRSRVAWPVQDELTGRSRPIHAAIALSVVGLALAAAGAGAITGNGGGNGGDRAPSSSPALALAAPIADSAPAIPPSELSSRKVVPAAPVLHGVAPSFKVSDAKPKAAAADPSPDSSSTLIAKTAPDVPPGTQPAGATDAKAGAKTPSPATIKPALDVSKQFADAFVLYEVGKSDTGVSKTFKKTAAKPLVRALKKRPPRLPDGVKVPKARVLNVVPGPRHGSSLSVSVALVRLGASSELRLELRHDAKTGWLVSDVRG